MVNTCTQRKGRNEREMHDVKNTCIHIFKNNWGNYDRILGDPKGFFILLGVKMTFW